MSKDTRAARRAIARSLRYFKAEGRRLPWRKTRDPYRIFVSEVMLQQTQVDRVIPKFLAFVERFPTWSALSRASLREVLSQWSGLGYNRRARLLHEAAKTVMRVHGGKLPDDPVLMESLPGVGAYTAAAVAAFAFNRPSLCIETNIRTVFLHHCFPTRRSVDDREILTLLKGASRGYEPRVLYSALMDYGAHLKRAGIRLNGKSKGYVKQKAFKGSVREARGKVLRALLRGPKSAAQLSMGEDAVRIAAALAALCSEGLVVRRGKRYELA